MPLSCGCSGDCEWFFKIPNDYSFFPSTWRRRRCSCGNLIDHGAVCLKFDCSRLSHNDIEERIHGEEVPLAPKWLCERCGDLYFSFMELGYDCVAPDENMVELVNEYKING